MDEPKLTKKHGTNDGRKLLNPFAVHKKKRSLVERELETNMTARITSPVTVADGESTSRYGRARRIKHRDNDQKLFIETLKSPKSENVPVKIQSITTKPAVNSSYKTETPKKALETSLDNIDNIYQDSKLYRFSAEKVLPNPTSSGKKLQKVYIRQDLIQNRDDDDDDNIMLIKDLFSPKSGKKNNKVIKSLSAKRNSSFMKQNGHIENASVVKALDFDDNKKVSNGNKWDSDGNKKSSNCNKRDSDGNKKTKENIVSQSVSENDCPVEIACMYEVGDLAWARMGTFPFWPCIITRDPESEMFVRKKLFGRVEHYILHVTFFGDNGRRSWVVDNMLRKYMGLEEFLLTREKYTAEDKKRDPRLYSAFFISEKKLSFWNASIEEAEMINREPKNQRIDVFNDMLYNTRESKKLHKSGKVTRTDSDVSLSESLYDSLFSEDDSKADDTNRSSNRSRNRSLDVSDVVTACLDNMAAKTGNIKIQKQSHMDRWLQKAKSKTPEKVKSIEQVTPKTPVVIPKIEMETPGQDTIQYKIDITNIEKVAPKVEKPVNNNKKKKLPHKEVKITKVYSLRSSYESQNALIEQTENKKTDPKNESKINKNKTARNNFEKTNSTSKDKPKMESSAEVTKEVLEPKLELLNNDNKDICATNMNDLSPTPHGTNEDHAMETDADKLAIQKEIKSEIMDVEESSENIDESTSKSVVIAGEILDSPIKIEKDLTVNDNLDSSVILDCDSPVKNEIDSSVKTNSSINKDSQAKQNTIEIDIRTNNALNETHQAPPTLKGNEMVSIPENALMTDDECDSVTSMDYNIDVVNPQGHNSSLTITNANENNDIVVPNANAVNSADIENNEKQDASIENIDIKTPDLISDKQNDTIDENEDVTMNEKDLLNESGASESILQIDGSDDLACDNPEVEEETAGISSNDIEKSESILETCKDDALELNTTKMTSDENTALLGSAESESFLGDSLNIDVYKDTRPAIDSFFPEMNMNKPPDLTLKSAAAKVDLLQNVENNDNKSEYDEESEDEPSPEYEPLGDDVTEDFRQHMKCIESSVTDKKDDAQLVKICNDIAIIEESKAKLIDIKTSMNKIILNTSMLDSNLNFALNEAQKSLKEEKMTEEKNNLSHANIPKSIRSNETKDLTKEIKAEILDGLNVMKKSIENNLKSPPDKKKHRLSLKREKSKYEDVQESIILNDATVNPRYKTIDQIEQIIKSKPKRLPIENGEIRIPEIIENGFYTKKKVDTPDLYDDDDFDIDEASVNSEDSEVSLSHEKVPSRRSLRSRPAKKCGLQDPEFLTYMELRQDDLMEQHPELSMDDIVLYLYKTFTYSKNLESESEELASLKSIKQETPPSRKKSTKNTQPKNTIENFFRVKYNNAKRTDFDSINGTFDSIEDMKPKRGIRSISPSDSGIGNSKDSNLSDTTVVKRKSITKEVKVELISDVTNHKGASSPKTPKRLRKKTTSPKALQSLDSKLSFEDSEQSLDKRVAVVVISPIKDKLVDAKYYENVTETNREPDIELKQELDIEIKHEPNTITKHESETVVRHELENITKSRTNTSAKHAPEIETKHELDTEAHHEPDTEMKHETESLDSDSELPLRQLRSKVQQESQLNELKKEILQLKDEIEDTASISSDEPLLRLKPRKVDKSIEGSYEDPEFLKYLELKQDAIIDENPQLSQNEIKAYLYKTWIYERNSKSELQKNDDMVSSYLVKGLNQEPAPPRKAKRKPKTEKNIDTEEVIAKDKPKRKTVSHYYNEAFLSDIEDELEVFELFKTKTTPITVVSKANSPKKEGVTETKTEDTLNNEIGEFCDEINTLDEIELYFKQLTSPKPNVFKGLMREKVCGICEDVADLIKCKGCNGTFHYDCVKKPVEIVETPTTFKGRKKKKKVGRKPKNLEDSEHSDEREASIEDISIEDVPESITIDADILESQLEARMKELLENDTQLNYDSYSSDDGIDWTDTVPGKCELVDVKLKRRTPPRDYTNFKCNNCQKYDTPVCFVCKSATSKNGVKTRQKCTSNHCHSYYHLECLDHWPQTQFKAGEWAQSHKKANEHFEAFTCPRHVCHTCVSDDPRGCKTRFSGDKLAKCVRCPATYHSFNKCLPAGTQILTASFIICPRHYEHRPGKVPCHVNTGWCFICALGGSLICCEYCPTSFHAECLNIKPPEGNYMCEDCETGRLPLYEEMVWVKLGHYRWWPGVILHPSEIPDNIMAVKHGLGEFVVRFFGQYDHYWVNRGRVFPYQEGDSGRISSQKSKIDVAFTTAMEHAQRAYEILKNAEPDEEECLDIASSLLPPHYVKLKCNKPTGSLLGRKLEDPSLSLTQCECSAADAEPCGPNSQCINRMLLTECGPTCRAGDRCNNRAFEKRLYPKLTPYKALHRGWGLKTLEDIKAGQFVIEYVGELLDEEEFQRRMSRKHEIRDENFYFLTLDKERMIDAGPKGNLARFMNHCCEPNCETQKWTVLGDIRVGLFAIEDIKANSEVTFNYNLECTGIEKKRCLCGAKRCSGYIGAKPKQLDESQRKKNGSITGKRKYTKRKNIDNSPSTIKNKVKKPLGRPPKPKELSEIEKDLLIIKSATAVSSGESSRCQSVEEKNLKPLKKKIDSNTTDEDTISSEDSQTLQEILISNGTESSKAIVNNEDFNTVEEVTIPNGTETSKTLKRKLDSNLSAEVAISSEPNAKRLKCDKDIEVGD